MQKNKQPKSNTKKREAKQKSRDLRDTQKREKNNARRKAKALRAKKNWAYIHTAKGQGEISKRQREEAAAITPIVVEKIVKATSGG